MARALLREPDLLQRIQRDAATPSLCTHCNRCMPTIHPHGLPYSLLGRFGMRPPSPLTSISCPTESGISRPGRGAVGRCRRSAGADLAEQARTRTGTRLTLPL
jgi:hypothetical protein